MRPIATPAFRPTADCIRNSFLNSGKRHLILTGSRKSGKSTLLRALIPPACSGIVTWAEVKKAVYLQSIPSGETVQVGVYNPALPGEANKMQPISESFKTHGVSALQNCMHSDGEWAFIDEIGYLESGSAEYRQEIHTLMASKRLIAAVRKQDISFLNEICRHEDVFLVDLDRPFGNTSCIIMASGLGKRFGSNKLMADFQGKPLICHALSATEGIFNRRIVVTRHKDVAALCDSKNVESILHSLPHRSDTIRLGLDAIGDVDGCVFCPGDQPLLRQETLASLALCFVNDPSSIWRTSYSGVPGAPSLFPLWAFGALRSLPEGIGGGHIIKKYPERVRFLPVRDSYELKDIDTYEDLVALSEQ